MSQNYNAVFAYNGAEYSFDVSDAADAQRMEDALLKMDATEKALPKEGKVSVIYKGQCSMLKEWLDDVLGEGAGKALCGERDNVMSCYNAYEAFLDFVAEQNQYIQQTKVKFQNRTNVRPVKAAGVKKTKK